MDSQRVTVIFFAIAGLDILNALDKINKQEVIEWLYAQQLTHEIKEEGMKISSLFFILSPPNSNESTNMKAFQNFPKIILFFVLGEDRAGFRGASFFGFPYVSCDDGDYAEKIISNNKYDHSHIANTFTALCTLKILGDDLSRVDSDALIRSLKSLQLETGSFQAHQGGSENDARLLYCACGISALLNDWSGVDTDKLFGFLQELQNYESGFSFNTGAECHGEYNRQRKDRTKPLVSGQFQDAP